MAGHLGKTIGELDITWDEFIYWQAFFGIEHPEEAANQRTASILAQITNMSGKSLKDGVKVTADEFLGKPIKNQPTRKQSIEAQIAFFKSMSKENK